MDDTDLSDRDPLTKIPGLSPLVASISHFAFILISAQTSRFLANKFIHDRLLRVIAEEFICTAQLCTNNFELGVVTEVYGFSGYAIGLFFTSLSYSSTFEDGTADPSECLDKYCKREMGPKECILRSVASVGGAAISYRASKVFWSFGMIPEHTAAYKGLQQCAASLQVHFVSMWPVFLNRASTVELFPAVVFPKYRQPWAINWLNTVSSSKLIDKY